jgi:hypothetical protein
MRLKFAPVALLALSVAFGSVSLSVFPGAGAAWAKGGKKDDKNGEVPDAFNKQFKWEEGVVGNNDQKLDRKKIAAMQEAARKEDAKHKNEPTVKKQERPAGVGVPSSSTLPTMDIEKPAAAPAAKTPKAHPVAAQPKTRDSLDQLLDSESKDTGGGRKSGSAGLDKVLAVGGSSASAGDSQDDAPAPKAKGNGKHAGHRAR